MAGLVGQEMRALWPVWAGATSCVVLAATVLPRFTTVGLASFFVGSVALAAMSIGHEYTNRTLPVLLSLPVDRRRVIAAKLLAVAPMLGSLGVLTVAIGPAGRGTVIGALSVLAAASLAPWLTMVCRDPLAGAVFALGITGMTHLASLGVVVAWLELFGAVSMSLQAFGDRILASGLCVATVVGAVASWRAFITLQAPGDAASHLARPRWMRSAMALDEAGTVQPARRSNALWLLVTKELRLQQMSIAVAAINVVIWLVTYGIVGPSSEASGVMAIVAVLYGGLLAILIGALASAEERHLGTLEWQTLLPVAAWRQFVVKAAVALILSLLLAFALPSLLARGDVPASPLHAGGVVLLTVGGLLVSSLCSSGTKAMALAVPVLFLAGALVSWGMTAFRVRPVGALAIVVVLVGLALPAAFLNHRRARS
jgi:ABC-type transport system involved in multi-copper enzyme maturation permease subunit